MKKQSKKIVVTGLWGYDDYNIHYELEGDPKKYDASENPVLLNRIKETIRKYHEEGGIGWACPGDEVKIQNQERRKR